MGILIFFSLLLVLIGVIVTLSNLKNMRRRARIESTKTTPITQCPGGQIAEIQGRIVPSEQGLIQTPFSGRQAVWAKIIVQEWRQHGRSGSWYTIVNEVDARQFLVEDGSGEYARIFANGAEVFVNETEIATAGTLNDAAPHLQAFIASRGLSTTGYFGFNKRMRFVEQVLLPGEPFYGIGPSARNAGPPQQGGYRSQHGTELALAAGVGEANELLLTNLGENRIVSKLLWGFLTGLIMTGIGVVGGLVLLLVMLID